MARATQLGTSSAAANTQPPPSAPAPSPSIARMTDDTTSDLKEIKQTTHASRTQRPRLRGARDIECADPTVDQERDDHGLEYNEAEGRLQHGRGPSTTRPRAVYNKAARAGHMTTTTRPREPVIRLQQGHGPSTTARPRACCNWNSEAAGLLQPEHKAAGLPQTEQRAECCNSEPRNRKSRPQPEGGQDLGGACDAGLRRSTANCGSTQAPLASVASAAAATAFTKTMGSRPKSTKPTRFAAASCKAESRSRRTAATITRSQLSSN